jgi:hypothetical protein
MLKAICRLALLLALAPLAGAQDAALSVDAIRHPAFEATGIVAHVDLARRGKAELRIARLVFAGIGYEDVSLHCDDFRMDDGRIDCRQGLLRRAGRRGDRPPLPFAFSYDMRGGRIELAVDGTEAAAWSPMIKRMRSWQPTGVVDLRIVADRGQAELRLVLRDVGFEDKAGEVAGAGIAATLEARAHRSGDAWQWHASLDWPQGELTRLPWHVPAGVRVTAQGRLSDAELDVRQARLEVAGLGAVDASLRWDRERAEPIAWGFVTERLDLATAMRVGVQPWLDELGFPAWRASGHARFSAEWQEGRLRRFYAGLEDAHFADPTGYIELAGVNAHIPWEESEATEAEVSVKSGRFGGLPFAKFAFPIELAGRVGRMNNVVAPMLDGRFEIEKLSLENGDAGWKGGFSGGIDGISMPKLTRALRLPVMAGKLSMRVPDVSYAGGVLALNGALGVEVFDGGLIVHQLRVIDPFSERRRFVADVTARNLDLGMLTRTFSFGSIEGRFDADLHELEMEGLKPLRFEARVRSSEGDYPRMLSLGALRDITALGEGGAAADAIPARAMGFGYARIDVGCKLANGICLLDGIRHEGDGVLLMEGSGIPSVNIIGYNRRIDWEALVARIREVIAGKPGVVIE